MKTFTVNLNNGYVKVTVYDTVPKGVKKYDKIRLEMVQDDEIMIDHFFYDKEALIISTVLMNGWLFSQEKIFPPGIVEEYEKRN